MESTYKIENSLGYLTGRYSRLMLKRVAIAFADNGLDISSDEWTVLVRLRFEDGLTQTAISEMISKDKTRTTRIISSIEEKNLVFRVSNKADNREKHVYLTENGNRLINKAMTVVQESLDVSYAGIKIEDLNKCREVLRQLYNNIS